MSRNSKAVFQLLNEFIFCVLLIITIASGTPNSLIIMIFSFYLLISGIVRLIFKIPVRGENIQNGLDLFFNIICILFGSVFPILYVCDKILNTK